MWEPLPLSACSKALGTAAPQSETELARVRDALYVLARLVLAARTAYDAERSECAVTVASEPQNIYAEN